jgi:hypothetical protein
MIYIYIVHIYISIYIYLFIYLYYDNINICSYFQVLESTATCRFCGFSPKAACKTCCAGTTAATAARSRGFQNAACYSPSKCQGILSSFESRHDTPEENFVFLFFAQFLGGKGDQNRIDQSFLRYASQSMWRGQHYPCCERVNSSGFRRLFENVDSYIWIKYKLTNSTWSSSDSHNKLNKLI